jgi:glycosyltransferase involved in cell wall biosynthesis
VKPPDFTIITPSFKQLDYLECCIASVADQGAKGSENVGMCESGKGAPLRSVSAGSQSYAGLAEQLSVEHIVQDAGSPGIEEFAEKMGERLLGKYGGEKVTKLEAFELLHIRTAHGYNLRIFKEKDSGMYDAVNKGFKKGTGKICAYLNCDEQYLQGALKVVQGFFENRINVEMVLGDVIVVGADGEAICHRKMVKPGLAHTWTCHFGALTAGIFFRENLLHEGLLFDTSYRVASDAEWFVRVLRSGKKIEPLRKTTSTFMDSGENLGLSSKAKEERERLDASAPLLFRKLRILWVIVHRFKKLISGAHRSEGVAYEIYMAKNEGRNLFRAANLRTTWPGRVLKF